MKFYKNLLKELIFIIMTKLEIINLCQNLGIDLEYDRWDKSGWMRFRDDTFDRGELGVALVIFKEHNIDHVYRSIRKHLIKVGKHKIKRNLKEVLKL